MERAAMKRAAIDRAASCALSRRTHEQVSSYCGRCMKRGRSLGFKVTGGGSDSKGRWLAQGRLWDLGEPLWGTRNRSTSNLTRSRCEGAPPVRVAFWVGTGWVGHRPPPPWRGVAPAPPSVVPGCRGGGPDRADLLRGGLATGRPRRGGGWHRRHPLGCGVECLYYCYTCFIECFIGCFTGFGR